MSSMSVSTTGGDMASPSGGDMSSQQQQSSRKRRHYECARDEVQPTCALGSNKRYLSQVVMHLNQRLNVQLGPGEGGGSGASPSSRAEPAPAFLGRAGSPGPGEAFRDAHESEFGLLGSLGPASSGRDSLDGNCFSMGPSQDNDSLASPDSIGAGSLASPPALLSAAPAGDLLRRRSAANRAPAGTSGAGIVSFPNVALGALFAEEHAQPLTPLPSAAAAASAAAASRAAHVRTAPEPHLPPSPSDPSPCTDLRRTALMRALKLRSGASSPLPSPRGGGGGGGGGAPADLNL